MRLFTEDRKDNKEMVSDPAVQPRTGETPMILCAQRRLCAFLQSAFYFCLLTSYFLLSKAFSSLSRTGPRLGFNRRASWNWVIASSSCPFCKKATPRLACASAYPGLILTAIWY